MFSIILFALGITFIYFRVVYDNQKRDLFYFTEVFPLTTRGFNYVLSYKPGIYHLKIKYEARYTRQMDIRLNTVLIRPYKTKKKDIVTNYFLIRLEDRLNNLQLQFDKNPPNVRLYVYNYTKLNNFFFRNNIFPISKSCMLKHYVTINRVLLVFCFSLLFSVFFIWFVGKYTFETDVIVLKTGLLFFICNAIVSILNTVNTSGYFIYFSPTFFWISLFFVYLIVLYFTKIKVLDEK